MTAPAWPENKVARSRSRRVDGRSHPRERCAGRHERQLRDEACTGALPVENRCASFPPYGLIGERTVGPCLVDRTQIITSRFGNWLRTWVAGTCCLSSEPHAS